MRVTTILFFVFVSINIYAQSGEIMDSVGVPMNIQTVPNLTSTVETQNKQSQPFRGSTNIDSLSINSSSFLHFSGERNFYFGNIKDTGFNTRSIDDYFGKSNRSSVFNIQNQRDFHVNNWIYFVFLVSLLIMIFLRLNFYKYLHRLRIAFLNITIAQQLFREKELGFTLASFLLNINFILVMGMYLYLLSAYFNFHFSPLGIYLWLFFCLIILSVYIIKYSFLRILTFLFPVGDEADFYNYNIFLFNKILGILFIIIVMVMAFAKPFIVKIAVLLSLGMVLLFFTYRLWRGMRIAGHYLLRQKFHFLLYLCTLEIAPALILIKLFRSWGVA